MQAMILAAGFGTRLLPYSQIKPKPLFPLLNVPLLLLTIGRLNSAGFTRIIINCHHLREQVVESVASCDNVLVQQEVSLLGTGGGLREAMHWMEDKPLLITNGDIYHTIDFQSLYMYHCANQAKATLAVHDFPRFNTLTVKQGRLKGFSGLGMADSLAFTGVHVIEPEILKTISKNTKSCIIERYKELVREGSDTIDLFRVDDCFWTDMGTPADYLELHGNLLHGSTPAWSQLNHGDASPFLVDAEARCGKHLFLEDWGAIGKATIGENVRIARSVIWDGAVIPDNSCITDMIVTK